MKIYNVLKTLKVGKNTAVLVEGRGYDFRNGVAVLDSKGKPYMVLSVGMDAGNDTKSLDRTSLLVKGKFKSNSLFV